MRIGFVADLLARNGVGVIVSAISPFKEVRDQVRRNIGEDFVEIFVDAPLEVCAERDVKGLYKKAFAGEIHSSPASRTPTSRPPPRSSTSRPTRRSPTRAEEGTPQARGAWLPQARQGVRPSLEYGPYPTLFGLLVGFLVGLTGVGAVR